MKNKFSLMCLVVASIFALTMLMPVQNAEAAFKKSKLISDAVFSQKGSMSASQINNFLNKFKHSCISPNSGFKTKKPTGYSPSGGFTYGSYAKAGGIIKAAASAYEINPRVLITTLEKEQSLVTGRNNSTFCNSPSGGLGKHHKYAGAMGFNCPDGGSVYGYSNVNPPLYKRNSTVFNSIGNTCVNTKASTGFSQQTIRAAWRLKFNQQRSKGNHNWAIVKGSWDNSDDLGLGYSGPMTRGTHKRCSSCPSIFYDGYRNIDGQSVLMKTGGTASLYYYTPHFHGNQLFVNLFENWFGSTTKKVKIIPDPAFGGDWNGNGTDSVGLRTGSTFHLDNNNDGVAEISYSYGFPKDTPIIGDWNGNGTDKAGIKRKNVYYLNNNNDGSADIVITYGFPKDTPISGDWDGDGKDEIGIKRGNSYYLNYNNDGYADVVFRYGFANDTPLSGDWDGDGKDEIGIKRGGTYYLNYDNGPYANSVFSYGFPKDKPISGDWDGDNIGEIGIQRVDGSAFYTFYLNNNRDGFADITFNFNP